MSKKKKQEKEIADKENNSEKIKTEETVNSQEEIKEEEVKTPLTSEELLAIEKDKNLRLFAEFDNFRRRTAKERIELYSTANQDMMTALLPILDNFERSIEANKYTDDDGPVLIYKQLKTELEKKGLKEIKSPIGNVLDTDFHEAITNIPVTSKKEKGKVIDVIEKGYILADKVLRYAKVVVGN
ncbi:nucleotide exchange factor GrpE [Flavobacteriales bacterium]|nr:nucleotide exchange factor GrpE [Flavobacteriales bacterium]